MTKKHGRRQTLRRCLWDVGSVAAISGVLILAHTYVERRSLGAHLESFEYALLQQALFSDWGSAAAHANDPRLPLVIDISPLRVDKTRPTNREELAGLVDSLRALNAAAIGLDIDFSPDDSGNFITPQDPQLFLKWSQYGNVRVGVFRREGDLPKRWLGHPEFRSLAAGMMLPQSDPGFAMQYSSPDLLRIGVPAAITADDYLLQMPAALYEVSHPGSRSRLVENPRLARSDVDNRILLGQFPIDYSFLGQIETIPYKEKGNLNLWAAKIDRRVVLIGDMKDVGDSRCTQARSESVPGVLIHASALATLDRGILRYVDNWKSLEYDLYICLGAVAVICLFRFLDPVSSARRGFDHRAIETLAFGTAAFLVLVVGALSIGMSRIFWPDAFWLAAALFVHPHLKDVSRIVLRGIRGLVWLSGTPTRATHVT